MGWFDRVRDFFSPKPSPTMGGGGATHTWEPVRRPPGTPRGIRNNNPGNIRGAKALWRGEVGRDAQGFCVFDTADNGLRALAKLLLAYRVRHGLDTVEEIIGRWAPPSENDTRAYVAAVAAELGVPPLMTLNVHDPSVLVPLVAAIVKHENGQQPYPLSRIRAAVDVALSGA